MKTCAAGTITTNSVTRALSFAGQIATAQLATARLAICSSQQTLINQSKGMQ